MYLMSIVVSICIGDVPHSSMDAIPRFVSHNKRLQALLYAVALHHIFLPVLDRLVWLCPLIPCEALPTYMSTIIV